MSLLNNKILREGEGVDMMVRGRGKSSPSPSKARVAIQNKKHHIEPFFSFVLTARPKEEDFLRLFAC